MNYYNEFDPFAAAWLRELIKCGLIPDGEVDTRSIVDVDASDLSNFKQVHFFAGIGGWSRALELAGWSERENVWTGSCPCQPFSVAGKQKGINDERHLWPEMCRLIRDSIGTQHSPSVIFGEQVASKDARDWLAGVQLDLEALDFAFGAADLCSAGVGAPHIRQRVHWVAHAESAGLQRITEQCLGYTIKSPEECESSIYGVGQSYSAGWFEGEQGTEAAGHRDSAIPAGSDGGWMTDPNNKRSQGWECGELQECSRQLSPWATGTHWIDCGDGKTRRVEPGIPLLAHGVPNRVGRLRGYGNAINPWLAAEFIKAFEESVGGV